MPNDFSSIRNLDLLWKVYGFVLSEQKKPDGGIFKTSDLSSSFYDVRHGFCSAAIRKFIDFRIETYDGVPPSLPFETEGQESLQRITYGAPGTGRSYGIEEKLKQCPDRVFRTTFHPDSDYSTFVGAYKPTMADVKRTYVNEGVEKEVVDASGKPTFERKIVYKFVEQAFTKAYIKAWRSWASIVRGQSDDDFPTKATDGMAGAMLAAVNALIQEHGGQTGFEVSFADVVNKVVELDENGYASGSIIPSDYCYNRVNAGIDFSRPALFVYLGNNKYRCEGLNGSYTGPILARPRGAQEDRIVGQCTNGKRVLSGGTPESIYLVIEEINRGNCAQVFGDIFQLLDRENGFSKYPIKADEDLRRHLAEAFAGLDFGTQYKTVQTGEDLVLPGNLYIWATMNTSDQSLFPMDSAFKRRWDWEYVPIRDGGKGWTIDVVEGDGEAAVTTKYDWWKFLETINAKIFSDLDGFGAYLRAKEPSMREKAYVWRTAIGLQKVDGLTPSAYLIATAKKNIEGEITLAESRELVTGNPTSNPTSKAADVTEVDIALTFF